MDYSVAVKTPLGRFNTVVSLDIDKSGKVSGSFEIMKLSSTFSGIALSEKELEFSGLINTPIGELEYRAKAQVEDGDFSGIAKTRVGDFEFMPLVRRKRK